MTRFSQETVEECKVASVVAECKVPPNSSTEFEHLDLCISHVAQNNIITEDFHGAHSFDVYNQKGSNELKKQLSSKKVKRPKEFNVVPKSRAILKTCKLCGTKVRHLVPHMKYSHGPRELCKICKKSIPKTFYRTHLMDSHGKELNFVTHTNDKKLTKCLYCDKKLLHIDAHMRYAHGAQINCAICNQSVPVIYMNGHIKYYHS